MFLSGGRAEMPRQHALVYVGAATHLIRPRVLSRLRRHAPLLRHISVSTDTPVGRLADSIAALSSPECDYTLVAAVADESDSTIASRRLRSCADAIATLRRPGRVAGIVSVANAKQIGAAQREALAGDISNRLSGGLFIALSFHARENRLAPIAEPHNAATVLAIALSTKHRSRMAPVGGFDSFRANAPRGLLAFAYDVGLPDWRAVAASAMRWALADLAFAGTDVLASPMEAHNLCLAYINEIEGSLAARTRNERHGPTGLSYRDRALAEILRVAARGAANLEGTTDLLHSLATSVRSQSVSLADLLSHSANAIRSADVRFDHGVLDPLLGPSRIAQVKAASRTHTSQLLSITGSPLAHLLPATLLPAAIGRDATRRADAIDRIAASIRSELRNALTELATLVELDPDLFMDQAPDWFAFVPEELASDLRDELWPLTDRAGLLACQAMGEG